uniref:CBP/p300-type HAT domain-containing protein n=1 Tax=Panagrolaimus superbus TaxID=310955 RepID=A0A914XUB2_9BILA
MYKNYFFQRGFSGGKYKVVEIPYFYGDFWYMEVERYWTEYQQRNPRHLFPVQLLMNIKDSMNDPVNKELMLIVDLMSPQQQSKATKLPLQDLCPTIECNIIADREAFLMHQRANGFSFQTIQHAHLSTKRLCYAIKNGYMCTDNNNL